MPTSFSKYGTILNFLAPFIASTERNSYNILRSRVEDEIAETQLEQVKSHRSRRNLKGFVYGRQQTRENVITLLADTCFNSWYYFYHHYQAQNRPIITMFFMDFTVVLVSPEFRTWHEKYEHNHPWLAHSYVFMIH